MFLALYLTEASTLHIEEFIEKTFTDPSDPIFRVQMTAYAIKIVIEQNPLIGGYAKCVAAMDAIKGAFPKHYIHDSASNLLDVLQEHLRIQKSLMMIDDSRIDRKFEQMLVETGIPDSKRIKLVHFDDEMVFNYRSPKKHSSDFLKRKLKARFDFDYFLVFSGVSKRGATSKISIGVFGPTMSFMGDVSATHLEIVGNAVLRGLEELWGILPELTVDDHPSFDLGGRYSGSGEQFSL